MRDPLFFLFFRIRVAKSPVNRDNKGAWRRIRASLSGVFAFFAASVLLALIDESRL